MKARPGTQAVLLLQMERRAICQPPILVEGVRTKGNNRTQQRTASNVLRSEGLDIPPKKARLGVQTMRLRQAADSEGGVSTRRYP